MQLHINVISKIYSLHSVLVTQYEIYWPYIYRIRSLAHCVNFNVCCQGETCRCLVVQRHRCFEKKRGDNSTTNRVLNIHGFHVLASSTTKTGRHDIAESGVKHNKTNKHKIITWCLYNFLRSLEQAWTQKYLTFLGTNLLGSIFIVIFKQN
jgi:hypothetical protein